jgi:hypothetical protein
MRRSTAGLLSITYKAVRRCSDCVHQLALPFYRVVQPDEASRAKNQLNRSLAMVLESHVVKVGRQVSTSLPSNTDKGLSSNAALPCCATARFTYPMADKSDSVTAELMLPTDFRVSIGEQAHSFGNGLPRPL